MYRHLSTVVRNRGAALYSVLGMNSDSIVLLFASLLVRSCAKYAQRKPQAIALCGRYSASAARFIAAANLPAKPSLSVKVPLRLFFHLP